MNVKMDTVVITGGSGLIGKNLTKHLLAKNYNVIILSRKVDQKTENPRLHFATWNIAAQQINEDAITKADYIIHLAGAGVMDKKWTEKFKKEIVESRTKSSELLIESLQQIPNKVKAVISASAIGWYGKDDKPLRHTEGFKESDVSDDRFLGNTCKLWEESIQPVKALNKRLVKLRTGIVLSNDGGAFKEFKSTLRFGIASILASGKQIISWIHIDDICRMYIYAMENESLHGSYNAVAPAPVKNKILILQLAEKLRKQFYIPVHVPKLILKLILGERSIEILKSATVSCEKIKAAGFIFLYPSLDAALDELTKK